MKKINFENYLNFYNKTFFEKKLFTSSLSNTLFLVLLLATFLLHKTKISKFIELSLKKKFNRDFRKKNKIAFIFTLNQLNASNYHYIKKDFEQRYFVNIKGFNLKLDNINEISRINVFSFLLINYPLIKDLFNQSNKSELIKMNSKRCLILISLENIFNLLIESNNTIYSFNDHSPYNILLHEVSKKNGAKTVYVQHAPITINFPTLYHDKNILFSQDSYEKYKKIGNGDIKMQTEILFDTRFLESRNFIRINKISNKLAINKILIAPNELDSFIEIKKTIDALSEFKIILRPHKLDKRNFNKLIGENVEKSSSNNIWEDLCKCQILLTNESAVVLEGIFFEKYIYKCEFWSEPMDFYGFVEKGLITKSVKKVDQLAIAIKSKEITYNKNMLEYFIGQIPSV